MPIKVNVSLSAGGQLKPVSSRTLDGAHITIGRDKECSLCLEDAQKHVSRVHAELDEEAGTYYMTVVSKVNPVLVNGKRHMKGERVALAEGDVLTIGLYKLEVLLPPAQAEPPPPPAEDMTYIPPAPAEPPAPPPSAVPDDLSADMTYIPPGPQGSPAPPPVEALADADLDTTYIPPAPIPPSPPAITPEEEITYVRPASELTNPLGTGMGRGEEEEDFSEDATYVRRPPSAAPLPKRTPDPAPEPVTQAATEPDIELDIELDFELDIELPDDAGHSAQASPLPSVATPATTRDAQEPAQIRPAVDASAQPAAGRLADASGAQRAAQAFLEGAGLRHLEIADPEAFLRDSGATVRAAIEGVMMLLVASTAVRKSIGADTADAPATNPLDAMTDPAKAIRFLFDPATRVPDGPDPVQALSDACSDLRVHQIALLACLQAAVQSALQSVDPRVLERDQGGRLGGLNITRKSRLWDLLVAHHEKTSLEIGESVNRVFGPAVQAAYLAEVRRIRGDR